MEMRTLSASLFLSASAMSACILGFSQDAQASGKFYCGSYNGLPSTMTNSSKTGKPIPIIMWKSGHFASDGWSPERRCEAVSDRFNTLHQKGQMNHLSTGVMNGMPVICAVASRPGRCEDGSLLYTLKPGQNPNKTLKNLLSIRTRATGPLTETASRVYVSISEIEDAFDKGGSLKSAKSDSDNQVGVGIDQSTLAQPANTTPVQSHGGKHEALW